MHIDTGHNFDETLKFRDDLAREALLEKRRFSRKAELLEKELADLTGLVEQYQDDIRQLEDKLGKAREKQRVLVQRHIYAAKKRRAQEDIRRIDTSDAVFKFEELENRIERMEAEAEMVNYGGKSALDGEFAALMADEEIEKELKSLKSSRTMREDAETGA